MKLSFPLRDSALNYMRKAGYHFDRHDVRGQMSFIRSIGRDAFPRFHAYVSEEDGELRIYLHLDQKRPTYQKVHSHSGEYEGEIVEQEGQRLRRVFGL